MICQFWPTVPRSSVIPTARKNSPSNMPRKGSTSASICRRKVDVESSTPARKAPIAIDSPLAWNSSAAPSTTSSAPAVITSRSLLAASSAKNGFMMRWPRKISSTTAPMGVAMLTARVSRSTFSPPDAGARIATSASRGTMARSSSSRMETMRCPCGAESSPRSPKIWKTMAVDVMTKPMPKMNATTGAKPSSTPTPVSSTPQVPTCITPNPKICLRSAQSLAGSISSPMMKRNITTPSSAVVRIDSGSLIKAMPEGPSNIPAARYPSTEPRLRRLNNGTARTAVPSSTTIGTRSTPCPAASAACPANSLATGFSAPGQAASFSVRRRHVKRHAW